MHWLKTNQMVVNASKSQVISFDLNSSKNVILEVRGCSTGAANSVSLFEVIIDSKLRFNQHVFKICQKEDRKTSAFSRVSKYLDEIQSSILYISFTASEFSCCSLTWMFVEKLTIGAQAVLRREHFEIYEMAVFLYLKNSYENPMNAQFTYEIFEI